MTQPQARIKIAIQKSGRLTEHCLELLQQCGLKYSRGRDQLIGFGENMPVDFLLVRDDDIPGLVRDDVCDLGIVGLNVLEEKRLGYASEGIEEPFRLLQKLDYGHCRLAFAYPEDSKLQKATDLDGQTIATSYPKIVGDYLQQNGLNGQVVEFSGAVEIAPSLGRAEIICDLVSTGATLAANRLVEGETILDSVACLIQTPVAIPPEKTEWVDRLVERIAGVQQVRGSKYIMMHAPRSALHAIAELLPGAESPTVLPLEDSDDKVAVHVVCRENVFWETLESLKTAGASSILVVPIEKMLA
ncbi:MAG: ATP phosphoribosyltransferase [Gammaproteobacteria bacterium]|jgi:ATP phosphoribosyltransferase|nr:ATP phosphoribosyltransferase [Gammaproteobacteria bacterium]MDP6615933.1 ATP phosphoribosyltransferase [Gammaproteobacteria bacterium]MDP6695028.1 ATP phosphoribosyltransferase [Gammaproteobacteria bacterium]